MQNAEPVNVTSQHTVHLHERLSPLRLPFCATSSQGGFYQNEVFIDLASRNHTFNTEL